MYKLLLILILLLAFFFRNFGINWDEGTHLHPDERMIIMVADRIRFPKVAAEWQSIFTPQSPLNPKFFAYGSFPIYLLKVIGWTVGGDNYNDLLTVGRYLSTIFDLGTVVLVFLLSKEIIKNNQINTYKYLSTSKFRSEKKKKIGSPDNLIIGLLASFFYAVSVLPIQSSHFFISDIPLTFFTTLVLYLSLRLILNSQFLILNSIFLGLSLGLALATKITAILLVIPILFTLLTIFLRFRNIKSLILSLSAIAIFAIVTFTITMPYGIIDFTTFKAHTMEQSRMRTNPFIFPFTLQYVNTTPYWYFVKNMILWGMGLPLGIIAVTGTIYVIVFWLYQIIKNIIFNLKEAGGASDGLPNDASPEGKRARKNTWKNLRFIRERLEASVWDTRATGPAHLERNSLSILLTFFIVYFLFMGSSAVKFMRYFLPIYPLFCIFGSIFVYQLIKRINTRLSKAGDPSEGSQSETCQVTGKRERQNWRRIDSCNMLLPFLLICSIMIIWPIAFTSIYARTHTRIAASWWIYENIPNGAKLGIEHWDDSLPLFLPDKNKQFVFVEFPLYEADTPRKWEMMSEKIKTVDYIIIASNRLYVPLMRLTDCQTLPMGKCYPQTADYYKKLFAGDLGFSKVAEFTSYPEISLGRLHLIVNDDSADESFTVYDHPKVMIFKKNKNTDYPHEK